MFLLAITYLFYYLIPSNLFSPSVPRHWSLVWNKQTLKQNFLNTVLLLVDSCNCREQIAAAEDASGWAEWPVRHLGTSLLPHRDTLSFHEATEGRNLRLIPHLLSQWCITLLAVLLSVLSREGPMALLALQLTRVSMLSFLGLDIGISLGGF